MATHDDEVPVGEDVTSTNLGYRSFSDVDGSLADVPSRPVRFAGEELTEIGRLFRAKLRHLGEQDRRSGEARKRAGSIRRRARLE